MTGGGWESRSDVELMDGLVAREEAALDCLIQRFLPAVFNVCARMLGTKADAEEATSDIFLEIWNHPDRFDESRGAALSYLLILTRSRCLDRLRSRNRERSRYSREIPLAEIEDDETSSRDLELDDLGTMVKSAVAQLPRAQQEAIELAFFDGMTHREIAAKLNAPLGSVKSHIRRGLLKLKSLVSALRE